MPKMVSEIAQGQSYEFSAGDAEIASRQVRVFRLIKSDPTEYINVFQACGVYIGNQHPQNVELYCESVSAQYEGDSRLVLLITFNYRASLQFEQSSGGGGGGGKGDKLSKPPDIRPANWSISSSLVEVPAFSWRKANPTTGAFIKAAEPITNPAGDLYEGVSKTEGIITISVEQWEDVDPAWHAEYAGYVNDDDVTIGGLTMPRRTLMFRGLQTQAAVEKYNDRLYKGWKATYEFLYRKNTCQISNTTNGQFIETDIGWDRAQPQSGFNVRAWTPLAPNGSEINNKRNDFSQPLKHENNAIKIPVSLPDGVLVGEKVRAMIKVAEYGEGKTAQRSSAMPVALNDDGSARSEFEDPPVLIYRYAVQPEIDLMRVLQIRLQP